MDHNKQVALGAVAGFAAGVLLTVFFIGSIALMGAVLHGGTRVPAFHGAMMGQQVPGGPGFANPGRGGWDGQESGAPGIGPRGGRGMMRGGVPEGRWNTPRSQQPTDAPGPGTYGCPHGTW